MAREQGADAARTRTRILEAAGEIARSGGDTRMSVRAVAQRAGVGIGTLRYHFPTQRALLDAVLSSIYEEAMPDDRIRDATVAPRDRLLESLRGILAPIGLDARAREVWTELHRTFIDPSAPSETRDGYLELSRQTLRRIESWLSILTEEGAAPDGDNAARARFLVTVLDGLGVERALPSDRARIHVEAEVLGAAVDHVLGT